jgi:hypothetical protein
LEDFTSAVAISCLVAEECVAPNVGDLTWERNIASSSGYITEVDDGVFKDRLDGDDEMITWKYTDMEAWGVYIDKSPLGLGSNLKILVYINGVNVHTLDLQAVNVEFFGVVSPDPFQKVAFKSAERPAAFETYTLDDMQIFPWCSPILGGLKGDPHIKTWSGEYYDYMGECDLVMLRDETLDLELDARTTVRYDYSFVESAALRIGEDTLEVTSHGIHSLNDIDGVFFADGNEGATIGGYPIYYTRANEKTHNFDVVLGSHENITFTVYKDIVSVTAGGSHARSFFEGSKGLMGSMDGTLLGRDGVTEFDMSDADAFGQEWQVRDTEPMIFRTAREPQYPSKCVLPSTTAKESRRLGERSVTRTAAEMACARFDGAVFEACVYDVLAFEDLGYAESGVY